MVYLFLRWDMLVPWREFKTQKPQHLFEKTSSGGLHIPPEVRFISKLGILFFPRIHLGGGNSNIFMFIPTWGRFPIWRAYFSDGLKPPVMIPNCWKVFFRNFSSSHTRKRGFPLKKKHLKDLILYKVFGGSHSLGGGFKHVSFSHLFGEMPPTSFLHKQLGIFLGVMFSDCRFYISFIVNSARHWKKPRPKKSTLVSVGEDFSDTAFSFRWKDPHDFEMDIMWISWIFFVWKSLFWLEIVEHGWGWEGVSNPFLGNMSSSFLA